MPNLLYGIQRNICRIVAKHIIPCQYEEITVYFYIKSKATVHTVVRTSIEINTGFCYPQASYLVGVALRERGIVVIVVAAGGEAERERGCKEQQ